MTSDKTKTSSRLNNFFRARSTIVSNGTVPFPGFEDFSEAEFSELEKDHCVMHCQHRICIHVRSYRDASRVFAPSECTCKEPECAPPPPCFEEMHTAVKKAKPTVTELKNIDKTKKVTIRSSDIPSILGYAKTTTKDTTGSTGYFTQCFLRYFAWAVNAEGTVGQDNQQRTMTVQGLQSELKKEALFAFTDILMDIERATVNSQVQKSQSLLAVAREMKDEGKHEDIWEMGEGMCEKLVWLFVWRDEELRKQLQKDSA